ncbi:MAG: hypothetical protein QOK19_1275 [Solirubrobacteraceae bacterium]|nr:hypothetical protein [Solirubrobacterales bacterium]MEA2215714.1 hypothetical protein [Solirubrobacteraceae bacterium]
MSRIKRMIGVKAAKATARHSAHGLSSKAQRKPLRSASLVSVGLAIGLGAGWAAGRGLSH